MAMLQLTIHLADAEDMPWRRIAIDERATFYDLHMAIQHACGWYDDHLYVFVASAEPFDPRGPNIAGSPRYDAAPPARKVPMSKALKKEGDRVVYWYDFGDDWIHEIVVESVEPEGTGRRLLGGAHAFPAEDSGGIGGYLSAKKLVHARDAGEALGEAELERLDWLGRWHPDNFDPVKMASHFDLETLPGL